MSRAFHEWKPFFGKLIHVAQALASLRIWRTMGYWLSYLTSRRYVCMYVGLGSLLIAAVSMLTGKTLERYSGLVSRDEEPKRFRRNVVGFLIVGLFFIGLSLIAFYLYGNPN
jgi:hypothetical protein